MNEVGFNLDGDVLVTVERVAIRFLTPDNFNIAGNFYADRSQREIPQPCVVLIHHFRRDKEQWGKFPDELVEQGFKVLAYDIRGHGVSDRVRDVTSLLSDPHQAPFDFDGALHWLEQQPGVDNRLIGVVGTSIGGNVACEANAIHPDRVKAAVAVSASLRGTLDFLEHEPGVHRLSSALFIAAEGDGTHARDAQVLVENYTDEPKDLKIYQDDSEHGVDLFYKEPEVGQLAVAWLKDKLK